MSSEGVDLKKRRMLVASTAGIAGVGTVAMLIPFVSSMSPSAKAKAAGAPVEANISKLEPGQRLTVEWRGKPVWVVRRTKKVLDELTTMDDIVSDPDSEVVAQQPSYAQNAHRSIKPEYAVLIGICTHLGCSPKYRPEVAPADLGADWKGGFFCPCHGSKFDLAGRVYKSVPAPTNLVVPAHKYLTDDLILVGVGEA